MSAYDFYQNSRFGKFQLGSSPRRRALAARPIAQAVMRERDRDRAALRPVELIFDILSRGQYASANVFEEALRGEEGFRLEDVARAAWQGFTGERKGDFEDVLFHDIPREERKAYHRVVGLAANILLDPTTYIGLGPTKAARMAAKSFADEAVLAAIRRTTSMDELARMSRKGFKPERVTELLATDPGKAARYISRFDKAGTQGDLARTIDKAYREARRRGLRMSSAEMQQELLGQLGEERGVLETSLRALPGLADVPAESLTAMARRTAPTKSPLHGTAGQLDDLVARITEVSSDEFMRNFERAGERSMRFMMKEFAKGVRDPNLLVKSFDRFGQALRATPAGDKFTDALWAVMNRGPMGFLRRTFGFHNPYQQALNQQRLDVKDLANDRRIEYGQRIRAIFGKLSKEEIGGFQRVMADSEMRGVSAAQVVATNPRRIRDVAGMDSERLRSAITEAARLTEEWNERLAQGVADGSLAGYNYIAAYFPLVRKARKMGGRPAKEIGPYAAGFTESRAFTLAERQTQETAKLQFLFGIDEVSARKLVEEHNVGDLVTNPLQAMQVRAFVQSKAEARMHMVEQFRQFGIKVTDQPTARSVLRTVDGDDITEELDVGAFNKRALSAHLSAPDADLNRLGLGTVNDAAFEGYVFDREVQTILKRAMEATATDESVRAIRDRLRNFQTWWKSVVTTSGGFHMRNFFSNQMTGFLKFGPRWFTRPDRFLQSVVATELALSGWDGPGMKALRKVMGDVRVRAILESRIGGHTVESLAAYARRSGVVAQTSRAVTEEEVDRWAARLGKKLNPLSKDFAPYTASRQVGSRVESVPRMQSFLMDLEDVASSGAATPHQMEWAKLEAKKWFMDYEDLSAAEQKYFKNLIPFYVWLRKNVANQISGLIEMPEMYSLLPKVQQAVEKRDAPFGTEMYPEWWREAGMFPIHEDENGVYVFRPNFPYQEGLNLLPFIGSEESLLGFEPDWRNWRDNIVNSLNPVLKSIIELVPEKGYDTFRREDLQKDAPAPRLLRLFTKRPMVLGAVDTMMKWAGWEGLRLGQDERGRLTMDGKMARLLDNFLPILDRLGDWMDFPVAVAESLGVQVEKAVTAATGAKDDYDGAAEMMRILSRTFGVKVEVMEAERARLNRAWEIWEETITQMQEEPRSEARSLRARRRQLGTFRRLGIYRPNAS